MTVLKHLSVDVLPKTLYHSSNYIATSVLKPGFEYTGKLVEWDEGESNKYLYATTDKEAAISLGFASAIEHTYLLDGFHTDGDKIEIESPAKNLSLTDLQKLKVQLYTIKVEVGQDWIKNNNLTNHLDTEYKTDNHITNFSRQEVNMVEWLKDKNIKITTS